MQDLIPHAGLSLSIRRSEERGHANHGWLDTRHTFSFANYLDPRHMGYRTLRVLNEDRVAPGEGFGAHPHRDMEILTYVLEGALEHRDSMGSGSVIRPGDLQRMSAGTGVTHSEFNHSHDTPVHFLQIWIEPAQRGVTPSYEQRTLPAAALEEGWVLAASPDGRGGALTVQQDVRLSISRPAAGARRRYELANGRSAWLQVARGELRAGAERLRAGDGLAVEGSGTLTIDALIDSEILLFDLA